MRLGFYVILYDPLDCRIVIGGKRTNEVFDGESGVSSPGIVVSTTGQPSQLQ